MTTSSFTMDNVELNKTITEALQSIPANCMMTSRRAKPRAKKPATQLSSPCNQSINTSSELSYPKSPSIHKSADLAAKICNNGDFSTVSGYDSMSSPSSSRTSSDASDLLSPPVATEELSPPVTKGQALSSLRPVSASVTPYSNMFDFQSISDIQPILSSRRMKPKRVITSDVSEPSQPALSSTNQISSIAPLDKPASLPTNQMPRTRRIKKMVKKSRFVYERDILLEMAGNHRSNCKPQFFNIDPDLVDRLDLGRELEDSKKPISVINRLSLEDDEIHSRLAESKFFSKETPLHAV